MKYITLILFFSGWAYGDDAVNVNRWFIYGGAVTSTSTSEIISNASGSPISTSDKKDNNGPVLGLQYLHDFSQWACSGVFEFSKYNYKDGSPADTQFAIYLLPQYNFTGSFWAGFGVGLMSTTLGQSVIIDGPVRFTMDSSTTSWAASPRIGYDWTLSNGKIFGIQGAWVTTSATLNGTASAGTESVALKDDFVRRWYSISVRYGF